MVSTKWTISLGLLEIMERYCRVFTISYTRTLGFWLSTKWGYNGLGSLWAVRFMGFATSMLIFPFMTYFYLNETITIKTIITLILSIIIMILQLI